MPKPGFEPRLGFEPPGFRNPGDPAPPEQPATYRLVIAEYLKSMGLPPGTPVNVIWPDAGPTEYARRQPYNDMPDPADVPDAVTYRQTMSDAYREKLDVGSEEIDRVLLAPGRITPPGGYAPRPPKPAPLPPRWLAQLERLVFWCRQAWEAIWHRRELEEGRQDSRLLATLLEACQRLEQAQDQDATATYKAHAFHAPNFETRCATCQFTKAVRETTTLIELRDFHNCRRYCGELAYLHGMAFCQCDKRRAERQKGKP